MRNPLVSQPGQDVRWWQVPGDFVVAAAYLVAHVWRYNTGKGTTPDGAGHHCH